MTSQHRGQTTNLPLDPKRLGISYELLPSGLNIFGLTVDVGTLGRRHLETKAAEQLVPAPHKIASTRLVRLAFG